MVGNSTQNSTNVLTDQLHSVVGFRNQVGINLQYTSYIAPLRCNACVHTEHVLLIILVKEKKPREQRISIR